ncbi:StAR-related lipid transfer protein 13 [Geodia barretti]|uniref:StAR-related lipid transfer protein 13 n=1 Tax=Geodia barretti TaxID=519541 RepID=A0AA35TRN9_GEOBA|nr:StAR-related lipid transfer protein 13 [Geodia barretti]
MLELYGCPVNIVRCLRRRQKQPEIKGKNVFGSSLSENVRRYGNPLPPTILCALQHLHDNGLETVGIFRRAAGKSRVGVLRGLMEMNPEYCDFEGYSVYDVADLVKQFFRELPEPLLTMDAKNLSLCFSPSLFSLSSSPLRPLANPGNPFPRIPSLKRHTINNSGSPLSLSSTKEVTETVTSSGCLQLMITHRREIFQVAADQLQVVKFSYLELSGPVPYHNLTASDQYGMGTSQSFLDSCITTILKESRRRFKDWVRSEEVRKEGGEGVEVSHVSVGDGVPLWVWRGTTDIPAASPKTVFERIWYQRHVWDKTMVSSWKVATLDPQTEVFQYVTRATPPLCDRDHCLMRSWHRDVPTGRYMIVATSVSHPQAELRAGIRAVHLASHFLLQPCPHGTTVTAISREDWRGHSSEYYNRSLGPYLVSSTLSMLRNSFRELDFLETPV